MTQKGNWFTTSTLPNEIFWPLCCSLAACGTSSQFDLHEQRTIFHFFMLKLQHSPITLFNPCSYKMPSHLFCSTVCLWCNCVAKLNACAVRMCVALLGCFNFQLTTAFFPLLTFSKPVMKHCDLHFCDTPATLQVQFIQHPEHCPDLSIETQHRYDKIALVGLIYGW